MVIDNITILGTTALGTFAVNTGRPVMGLLRQIIITPTTSTTIYDIKLTSPQNSVVYERTSETGTLAELLDLPMMGIYTLTVSNATADEDFTIYLMTEE